ncbi:hypothetical protein DENIT_10033 [Pseudomonas veronii]|nr:hypothetical protein DENIT_10033 [Pseudomonas veronii]
MFFYCKSNPVLVSRLCGWMFKLQIKSWLSDCMLRGVWLFQLKLK